MSVGWSIVAGQSILLRLLAVTLASTPPLAAVGSATQDQAQVEGLQGVTVTRRAVPTAAGHAVQTYLSRPRSASGRLPAILFVQWLSCDPVTLTPGRLDGWSQMLRSLIEQSGLVVMRTEKPGLGGSGGPPCSQLDYATELEAHRAALQALKESPGVFPDSVFIFGASMGGTMAPLLAGAGVRGVIVWGTTGYSWFDHLMSLDRRVLGFRGLAREEIDRRLIEHRRFLEAYLRGARTPPDIILGNPSLQPVWEEMIGTSGADHYGRPFQFHQQAERAGWREAWARFDVPVLIIHGELDWLMDAEEHRQIFSLVNRSKPPSAELVTIPQLDHHFERYRTLDDAYVGRGGKPDATAVDTIRAWINRQRVGALRK